MQIIAHRGASGSAPENTLSAFRLAWQLGADGIELDVHLSRDAQVMVHHDADTARCAGVKKIIAATDSEELRRLDVGRWRGERFAGNVMPLLTEVLQEAPAGKRVLIEIKSGPQTALALRTALAQHAMAERKLAINLISFRLDSLLACREVMPQLPCYAVFSSRDKDSPYPYTPMQWIEQAEKYGFAGLDPDYRDIDAELAQAARAAGLELITWTVNDAAELLWLDELGVAAVATDWPQQMQQALRTRA